MLRVKLILEPNGHAESARSIGEIEIINITNDAGRTTDDYLWRIRAIPKNGAPIDACGYLVDDMSDTAVHLLGRVLDQWQSGDALPADHHGRKTLPERTTLTAREHWQKIDRRHRK